REEMSIGQAVERVLARFTAAESVEFAALFAGEVTRAEVIVTFLALLELIRLCVLRARQAERFGAITLTLAVATVAEAAGRVHDLGRWSGEEGQNGDGDRDR